MRGAGRARGTRWWTERHEPKGCARTGKESAAAALPVQGHNIAKTGMGTSGSLPRRGEADLGDRPDVTFLFYIMDGVALLQVLEPGVGHAVTVEVKLAADIVQDEAVVGARLDQRDLAAQRRGAWWRDIRANTALERLELTFGGIECVTDRYMNVGIGEALMCALRRT